MSGGAPPITPSWAGELSPGTLRAWGRARNLGDAAGALVLLGTACLPPSGLLKSLEDSGKLLGKESTCPCLDGETGAQSRSGFYKQVWRQSRDKRQHGRPPRKYPSFVIPQPQMNSTATVVPNRLMYYISKKPSIDHSSQPDTPGGTARYSPCSLLRVTQHIICRLDQFKLFSCFCGIIQIFIC